MKTIKSIIAVAMVLLITACGGKKEEEAPKKKFDIEKAQELADKYHNYGRYGDWNDFADMYDDFCEEYIYVFEKSLDNISDFSSIEDFKTNFNEQNNELYKLGSTIWEAISINSIPQDISKRLDESSIRMGERLKELNSQLEQQFNKKVENQSNGNVADNRSNESNNLSIKTFPEFAQNMGKQIYDTKSKEEFDRLSNYAQEEMTRYLKACKNASDSNFIYNNYYPLESALIEMGESWYYPNDSEMD